MKCIAYLCILSEAAVVCQHMSSSSLFVPILNCLKPKHSNDLSQKKQASTVFLANQDETQPALRVSHFSYSDQIEQNKMASHSQMGGSSASRFHPARFCSRVTVSAARSWKGYECAWCRRLRSPNLGQRSKPPQLIYPDCASVSSASLQLLILRNENLFTEGEKHPILRSLVIYRRVLISYSVWLGFN